MNCAFVPVPFVLPPEFPANVVTVAGADVAIVLSDVTFVKSPPENTVLPIEIGPDCVR